MSNYRCMNCGAEFTYPVTIHEEGMQFKVCPECKSEDWYVIRHCKACGKELKVDDWEFCVDCHKLVNNLESKAHVDFANETGCTVECADDAFADCL